jgi:hypothetical protein
MFIRDLDEGVIDRATVRCIREVSRRVGKKTIAGFAQADAVEMLLRETSPTYRSVHDRPDCRGRRDGTE